MRAWGCVVSTLAVAVVVAVAAAVAQEPSPKRDEFREVFVWKHVDFAWPHDSDKARALDTRAYQPENAALQAVRAWRGWLLLTLPRWRAGVPATLAAVEAGAPQPAPPLQPFPSWDMQATGNCSAIQSAQAIDITPQGRLWVVDGGRAATLDAPSQDACPPKVLIFDLDARNLSASRLWRSLLLPPGVLSPAGDSSFADVAADADDVAYVSDASATDAGVVVVDARAGRVWKARDARSMSPAAAAADAGPGAALPGGVWALALERDASGRGRRIFYAPLRSRELFALEAADLRDEGTATDAAALAARVAALGNKTSASAAMAAAPGLAAPIYLALNAIHSVARWDAARGPLERALQVLAADSERLQWPSSVSLDPATGSLWVVSNRLTNFLNGAVNVDEPNYRVMRAYVGDGTGVPQPPPPAATPVPATDATVQPSTTQTYSTLIVPNSDPQQDKFNYTTYHNHSTEYDEHKVDGAGGAGELRAALWCLAVATLALV